MTLTPASLRNASTEITSGLRSPSTQMSSYTIYDNIAYIYGVAKSDKQPDVDNHLTFDIGEEGNVDRIARVLDLSFSEIPGSSLPLHALPACWRASAAGARYTSVTIYSTPSERSIPSI